MNIIINEHGLTLAYKGGVEGHCTVMFKMKAIFIDLLLVFFLQDHSLLKSIQNTNIHQ